MAADSSLIPAVRVDAPATYSGAELEPFKMDYDGSFLNAIKYSLGLRVGLFILFLSGLPCGGLTLSFGV